LAHRKIIVEIEFPGREVGPQENNKVEIEFPGREVGPS
jgi:hypothetical protein